MMLLRRVFKEMLKFAFNHKARYCYLAMTLWIFVLITVMYKYVVIRDETLPAQNPAQIQKKLISLIDLKYKRLVTKMCRPPVSISRGSEGAVDNDAWLLQGVLVLTRHGDRGPLTHLKNGEKIPCDVTPPSDLLKRYEDFIHNVSGGALRGPWAAAPGPFHNFPTLPVKAGATRCPIAQMTSLGVLQMLTVGTILKEAYSDALGLNADNLSLKPGSADITVWSTRYRRTYQSLLAVVWGASGGAGALWRAPAQCKEAHAVAYCFSHCACANGNKLTRKINAEAKSRLESQPAIKKLVAKISNAIFETREKADPDVLRDALLAYVCHDAPLPCHKTHKQKHTHKKDLSFDPHLRKLHSFSDKQKRYVDSLNNDIDYERSNLDLNNEFGRKARDIINMVYDGKKKEPIDFDAAMEKEKLAYYQQKYLENDAYDDGNKKYIDDLSDDGNPFDNNYEERYDKTDDFCLRKDHVVTIFSYLDWALKQTIKSTNSKRNGILTAYGLIQNIVQNMIRMISENKPKFVLYSGHDTTIQALLLSLGLQSIDNAVHYASRIIFEVYRKKELRDDFLFNKRKAVAQDFYFRVVYNGLDVTNRLQFCSNKNNVAMDVFDSNGLGKIETYLCPIESIVRFLHDDYFSIFNASNFKDACLSHKHAKLRF